MLQNLVSKIPYISVKNINLSRGIRSYSNFIKYVSTKRSNISLLSFQRSMSLQFRKTISPEKLRIQDQIPKDYELIYRCTMSSYLRAAQITTVIGVVGITVMFLISYTPNQDFKIDPETYNIELTNEEHQLLIFAAAFLFVNVAACILVSKFPVRIYYNEQAKKYLGFTYGILPSQKVPIQFNAGDLIKKQKNQILPWEPFKYKIKNGPTIILLDHFFRRPQDFNIMLGYTKL